MSFNKTFTGDLTNPGGGTAMQLASSVAGAGLTGGAGQALAVGAGASIQVNTNDIAYVGTTSLITLNDITGNQGTVSISALECGGCVRVTSPAGNWQIEGFSAKTDGFWFVFQAPQNTAIGTLFYEDATATAADRMRLPQGRDYSHADDMTVVCFYSQSRWRCAPGATSASSPLVELEVSTTGTIASQARTNDARHIMYTGAADTTVDNIAAGSYRGQIIVVSGQNGRVVLPDNAGATAAERIANPANGSVIITDEDFVPFIYLDDSSAADAPRWCNLKHTAPFVNTTANLVGDTIVHNGLNWIVVHEHFNEEFCSALQGFASASGNVGKYYWQNVSSDDGPFAGIDSEASHPGIVQITGDASGDTVRVTSGGLSGTAGTNYINQFVLGDVAYMRVIVRIPSGSSLTSTNYGIGLMEDCEAADVQGTTPNLGNNGLILHKNTGQTVWNFRRETASTGAIALSARTAVLGDWIEVYFINNGGGDWSFVINGTLNASSLSGVSTTALVRPVFFMHQTVAAARTFDVDKFEVGLRFQAARFTA